MNDPWDVKSVRLSEQYVSCMKINGVPLLPPLLSKQCRKEMQYYKLLAKEVENRITHLKIINNECASSEDSLNGLEIPECEHSTPRQDKVYLDVEINKSTPSKATTADPNLTRCNNESPTKENLKLDKTRDNFDNAPKSPKNVALPIEIPERDCNNIKEQPEPPKKDVITDTEEIFPGQFEQKYNYDPVGLTDTLFHGPSSLSSKSFTGSLNDLHSEVKELDSVSKLVRQNSYTILQPSPQLMAHLQVQSQCTGMDIMSISMSESLSNLSSANKKRRSWDLETAKVKWSTMAMELKKKNLLPNSMKPAKTNSKSTRQTSPTRSKSQGGDKPTKQSPKTTPKSEPIQRPKKTPSNLLKSYPSDKTLTKADTLPKNKKDNKPKQETNTPKTSPIINQSEDPATKVRELYEKVQKQQLIQMANLIEKQKKEQMLLQKLFDEQQTMLLKQLKTICPESPKEVKQAWVNSQHDIDAGPVSLSQLIQTPTQKSPDQQIVDNAISSLQDTSKYIDHCDQILRKSKDLSHSIKKHTQSKSGIKNGSTQSTGLLTDGSITRQVSPVLSGRRSTPASRKLNYETSASYDHDYDPMFTDRTNDTFADLNVTFPSDSDDFHLNNTVINNKSTSYDERSATSIDSAIINMQEKIKKSIRDVNTRPIVASRSATDSELAAATKITAFARGYLVRRLLRTERVQGTVQTIKDALLCALQLHQDREGIRGADVDLHRRLIQQITAACYCLHDTFVVSTPAERCAMIAADRAKRRASAAKPPPMTRHYRPTDAMSLSHTGAFPSRVKRQMSTPLSQSTYETFSNSPKGSTCSSSYARGPPRRPWR